MRSATEEPLLQIEELRTHFQTEQGTVKAVDGVDLVVGRGEVVGIVGESGCGKTVLSLSIVRLVDDAGIVSGAVRFDGHDLLALPESALNEVRGSRIAMIFQQPRLSLNPVMTVGKQIGEVLRVHDSLASRQRKQRAVELLDRVGIPDPARVVDQHPHQLSGGMAQRVMIAIALAGKPDLLIADEPTTALDVTVQAQILGLLQDLRATEDMAIILITHDLEVVAEIADRVAVMYAGRIVEECHVDDLYERPLHPYTIGLMQARPGIDTTTDRLTVIPGMVPVPIELPPGCRFAPRCDARIERGLAVCTEVEPHPFVPEPGRVVRCWLHE
ncbi:MAG: ABC transporter ATP-binding protein [Acidimicrobiia bacterium]|nr:ABC transporter ATP-binding protein [Acidimicrobiia bacterium]